MIGLVAAALAAGTAGAGGVTREVFDNGLTVIVKETHAAPVVAILAGAKVGSAVFEPESLIGISHFVEHMLFKGTECRCVGEIAREVSGLGGYLNGFTYPAGTNYVIVLPSRHFDLGLQIQADAMMHSVMPEEAFDYEREVVMHEEKAALDLPSSYTWVRLYEHAFTEHHYGVTIDEYEEVLQNLTRDDLVDWYHAHYKPGNMTVAIVGDIDTDEVLAKVAEAYREFEPGEVSRFRCPPEPEQQEMRVGWYEGDVEYTYLRLGFHTPELTHEDSYALDVLGTILGGGRASRLERTVKEGKGLVTSISASNSADLDESVFTVWAELESENVGSALESIFEEMEKLKRAEISVGELRRARAQVEIDQRMQNETVEDQAIWLIVGEQFGDHLFVEHYYDGLSRVTRDDIMRVAREYLTLDNCTMVVYQPTGEGVREGELSAQELQDRLGRVMAEVRVEVPAGEGVVEEIQLPRGITLLLKENDAVPLVSVAVLAPGGVKYERPERNGISNLMQQMLMKGTETRSAARLADELASIGAEMEPQVDRDYIGCLLNVGSEYLEEGIDILADVLLHPAFEPEEIEREKQEVVAEIRVARSQLLPHSLELCDRAVYGDHPYGLPVEGSEESLRRLKRSDLASWHEKFYLANTLVISVVGDIDREAVRTMIEEAFAPLRAGKPPTLRLAEIARPEAPSGVAEVQEKRQTHLVVGMPGPGINDPDYYAFQVLNDALTGMGSRLFVNLRDAKGLAYTVFSYLDAHAEAGAFKVYIGTEPAQEEEAKAGILEELRAVRDEGITEGEFRRGKDHLIGARDVQLQRNSVQALLYARAEVMGTGFETVDQYQQRIENVTEEDVARVAEKYIDTARYSLGVIRGATEERAGASEGVGSAHAE
jgi:zinc protease